MDFARLLSENTLILISGIFTQPSLRRYNQRPFPAVVWWVGEEMRRHLGDIHSRSQRWYTVYSVYTVYTVYYTLLVPKVHPNLHSNHIDKYFKSNFLKDAKVEPNQHRIHSGALFAFFRFWILELKSMDNQLSCGTEWKWSSGQIYI